MQKTMEFSQLFLPLNGNVSYLRSLGVLSRIVIPANAQHILGAVVEFREAIELAPVVVDGRLVHTTEGGLGLVGAVEEGLENLSALIEVSRASQVKPGRANFILKVCGQTRVQHRSIRCLTDMLA